MHVIGLLVEYYLIMFYFVWFYLYIINYG